MPDESNFLRHIAEYRLFEPDKGLGDRADALGDLFRKYWYHAVETADLYPERYWQPDNDPDRKRIIIEEWRDRIIEYKGPNDVCLLSELRSLYDAVDARYFHRKPALTELKAEDTH